MNVLMLVSWYAQKGQIGGEIFHFELAVDLNRFCNCAIYYPYDRYIVQEYESGMENGVMVFRSKYALKYKIKNRLYMLRAMHRIVEEFQTDIIHGNRGWTICSYVRKDISYTGSYYGAFGDRTFQSILSIQFTMGYKSRS